MDPAELQPLHVSPCRIHPHMEIPAAHKKTTLSSGTCAVKVKPVKVLLTKASQVKFE